MPLKTKKGERGLCDTCTYNAMLSSTVFLIRRGGEWIHEVSCTRAEKPYLPMASNPPSPPHSDNWAMNIKQ